MRTEDDLRAALRDRAESSAPPDVGALIEAARLEPSRAPRHAIVSASVALLMIALATPFIYRLISNRSVTSGTAHRPLASTMIAPTPQWVAETLIGLIAGSGTVSILAGHGGANYAAATFTFDDGQGAALVYITAAWPVTNDDDGPTLTRTGCRDQSTVDSSPGDIHWGTETLTCTTMTDGTQVGVGQPRLAASTGQKYGLALNNVAVLRPDGFWITIGTYNQPDIPTATPGGTTRLDPPFTVAELTKAALSSRWSTSVPAVSVKAARTLFPTAAARTKPR